MSWLSEILFPDEASEEEKSQEYQESQQSEPASLRPMTEAEDVLGRRLEDKYRKFLPEYPTDVYNIQREDILSKGRKSLLGLTNKADRSGFAHSGTFQEAMGQQRRSLFDDVQLQQKQLGFETQRDFETDVRNMVVSMLQGADEGDIFAKALPE